MSMARPHRSVIRFAVVLAVVPTMLGLAPMRSTATPALAQQADLAAVHERWLDAMNRGDAEAASELFTEDALYEGGLTCSVACLGRAALRRELEVLVDDHTQITPARVRASTTSMTRWLTTWNEVRSDTVGANGAERAISVTSLGARGDKIVFLITRWDRTDAQTDAFLTSVSSEPPTEPAGFRSPPKPTADGRLVDVGGRRMYIECLGEGSPTVVLEGGLGSGNAASNRVWNVPVWAPHITIQPDLAQMTRVCAYDRAGYGLSDPGPTPHTALSIVDDLHALLHAAGVEPPYVLAGISFGGPIVQVYASRFADEVAGVVEIDPGPLVGHDERIQALLPPSIAERRRGNIERNNARTAGPESPGGGTDLDTFLAQVRESTRLPKVPFVVLTAVASPATNPLSWAPDFAQEVIEQIEQSRLDSHAAIARLVPGGTHVLVDNSDHGMNFFATQAVTDTILRVVRAASPATGIWEAY